MNLRLHIIARPGAKTQSVLRNPDGSLTVKVRAQAVRGAANAALMAAIAEYLGIPRTRVRIVAGHRQRRKIVAVD
ncbi:MAG: DUF167 domain-containing protein [candidate division WOR-3 bacterium]